MHYFIVRVIVERLRLEPLIIPQIKIEMLDGDRVHNSLILVYETIFLKDRAMVVDLIIIGKPNFNVILGMDFLSKFKVKID